MKPITVEIQFSDKRHKVDGLEHDNAPGLAVTMTNFGSFEVTHVPTGRKIGSTYERAANAILTLARLQAIADANEFSWSDLTNQIQSFEQMGNIRNQPVPFDDCTSIGSDGTRPLTINEWFGLIKGDSWDEFPHEAESPIVQALEILEGLADA